MKKLVVGCLLSIALIASVSSVSAAEITPFCFNPAQHCIK